MNSIERQEKSIHKILFISVLASIEFIILTIQIVFIFYIFIIFLFSILILILQLSELLNILCSLSLSSRILLIIKRLDCLISFRLEYIAYLNSIPTLLSLLTILITILYFIYSFLHSIANLCFQLITLYYSFTMILHLEIMK